MTERHGFDISDPGAIAFTGFDVAGGYIGGATPHVWTLEQWQAQPARWRAPFWLLDTSTDAAHQGSEAVARMRQLKAPAGSIIFLDMETRAMPNAVSLFADVVHGNGYTCGVYGSASTLFGNPARAGYFVADPTGQPHFYGHADVIATQYGQAIVHGATVDLDLYLDRCPLWDTRPGGGHVRPDWAREALADLGTAAGFIASAIRAITANT